LPVESVLRCALLKQQRQLSYEELAFHLEDSASFRAFARLPLGWSPKKSVLHQTIGAIGAETWEAVNQALLASAKQDRLESGATVRLDSTVGADARAQRQRALMGRGAGHDAAVAPRRDAAGSAGDQLARPPTPRQKAGPRHRVQPRAGQKAPALLRADRRRPGQPRRTAGGRRRGGRDRRDGGRARRPEVDHYLPLIARIIAQSQRRVLDGEAVPAGEKLVSLFEPHADIIVKGGRQVQYDTSSAWPPARVA